MVQRLKEELVAAASHISLLQVDLQEHRDRLLFRESLLKEFKADS